MKIAFLADGRADHARRWISACIDSNADEAILLSTMPCDPIKGVRTHVLSNLVSPGNVFLKKPADSNGNAKKQQVSWPGWLASKILDSSAFGWVEAFWSQAKILNVPIQARQARRILDSFQPDLVHAFRIQHEGYVAAAVGVHPALLSVWGSDFTRYARKYPLHRLMTYWSVPKFDAVTADCKRDISIAKQYADIQHTSYFPGNGGIDLTRFPMGPPLNKREMSIVYARGVGPYLRPQTLFDAFSKLLTHPGLSNVTLKIILVETQVKKLKQLAQRYQIPENSIEWINYLTPSEWARVLYHSTVFVSPSTSDGTPNSMLEAMACGSIPVMSNLDSIREWVRDGENGLLFDPDRPDELLECLKRVFNGEFESLVAQSGNRRLIEEKNELKTTIPRIREFYSRIIHDFQ